MADRPFGRVDNSFGSQQLGGFNVVRALVYGTIRQRDYMHRGSCFFRLIASDVSTVAG